MSGLLTRIATESANFARRVGGSSANSPVRPAASYSSSYSAYQLREMFYDGSIYQSTADGGALKEVLKSIGRPCRTQDESKYPISGYFNPVKGICGFYSNAFGGQLGIDLKIADTINEKPISDLVKPLVRRVWEWSNLDRRAEELTSVGSNQGSVGIRIVHQPGPPARVYLDFDHPDMFSRPPELDNRGNVITAYLEYEGVKYEEDGTETTVKVEEVISKYGFSLLYDGEEQLDDAQQKNDLGVCPYVLVRHELIPGQALGRHAYHGSERAIHGINFGLSQLDESIVAHVWPYLFATSPAKKPTKFTTGRYSLIYSQSEAGKPQPTLDTLVPSLDFSGAIEHLSGLVDFIRERQPQLALGGFSLLSGLSGETLQQYLKQAEAESLRARSLYEDGVISAVRIAMSIGIFHGLPGFELATGIGKDGAERAFGDGEGPEAFRFERRPGLPPTVAQQKDQAEAEAAPQKAKFELAKAAKDLAGVPAEVLEAVGIPKEMAQRLSAISPPANPVVPGVPNAVPNGGRPNSPTLNKILGLP